MVEDGIVFDPETPFTFYFTQISNVEGEADTSSTDLCNVEGEEGNWPLSAECWINSRWNIATYALSDVKYGEASVAFDGEHELTITSDEENSTVVPEEPEQTDAFRIGSFGWGNNCIDNESRAGRQIYCVVTDKYGISVKTDTVTLNMA